MSGRRSASGDRLPAALEFDLMTVDVAAVRRIMARAQRLGLDQTFAGCAFLLGEIDAQRLKVAARKARRGSRLRVAK